MNHPFSKMIVAFKDYLYDKEQSHNRIVWFSKLSVIFNASMALGKIVMGICSLSVFLCINGFYNIGIGSAKAIALKGYTESRKRRNGNNNISRKDEYHYYYLVGIIVMISSIIYVIYYIRLFLGEQSGINYTLFMVLAICAFSIVELILSLRGIFTTRRLREPILEAIKSTNLVSSMISFALVQTAIMSYFGRSSNFSLKLVGLVLGVISACIGFNMIINMSRIINGKNHVSIIKKANAIAQKSLPGLTVEMVKYEDNGPDERFLYIADNHDDETFRRIKAEIESKMNLEVKQL